MLTGNDLPAEIWLAIAAELVSTTYSTSGRIPSEYMAVNRTLFNLYLDAKYGDVHWTKLDKGMMSQLRRLQDPIIACHVKRLDVHAWFIEHLLKRAQAANAAPRPLSMWERIQHLALSFLFPQPPPANLKPHIEGDDFSTSFAQGKLVVGISSSAVLDLMISAIKNMRNVAEYRFELRDLLLTKDSERFLVTARQAFGTGLRKLALHTDIFKFKSILELTDFENLDELELHFGYHTPGTADAADIVMSKQREAQELMDTVVPFINLRKRAIRSFTLASSSYIDLSLFFQAIGPFPSLRRFSANFYLDEPQFSDINSFVRFLHIHQFSLLHVDLKVRTPDEIFVSTEDSVRRRRQSWIRTQHALVENTDVLTSMESLHIPVGNLELTLTLLGRSSHSLTRLSLNDHFFDMNELGRVLSVFSQCPFQLQSILINVKLLSLECLKLLASRLPGLRALVLIFDDCDHGAFLDDMKNVQHGELDWHVQHITVFSRHHTSISVEDAALLGISPTITWAGQEYINAISKKLSSIRSYQGVKWHRQTFW